MIFAREKNPRGDADRQKERQLDFVKNATKQSHKEG